LLLLMLIFLLLLLLLLLLLRLFFPDLVLGVVLHQLIGEPVRCGYSWFYSWPWPGTRRFGQRSSRLQVGRIGAGWWRLAGLVWLGHYRWWNGRWKGPRRTSEPRALWSFVATIFWMSVWWSVCAARATTAEDVS